MLEVNEFLVLDFVGERERTSRPEIARALDLSPASVSRMVGRLLRAGLVVESGRSPSDGGRPAGVVSFNRRAGGVIAIDLGATSCRGALADLAGDFLYEEVRLTRERGAAFPTLRAAIDALALEAARQDVPVTALAVGVPAIVDPETGCGTAGPSVEWDTFDIATALSEQVAVPFVVENDVNLAALAHAWRGDGRHVDDFFTLYLGAGVGGAVVSDGRLVKGHRNAGGEIGFLLLDVAGSHAPLAATIGDLELATSAGGLLARARHLAEPDDPRWDPPDSLLLVDGLFQAASDGDPIARQVIGELLDLVVLVLVAVRAIVDPPASATRAPRRGSPSPATCRSSGRSRRSSGSSSSPVSRRISRERIATASACSDASSSPGGHPPDVAPAAVRRPTARRQPSPSATEATLSWIRCSTSM